MKAICPISGVPFRTYDSLPISVAYYHPIFSLSYNELLHLLSHVKTLEEEEIARLDFEKEQDLSRYDDLDEMSKPFKKKLDFSQTTIEAIHEKNYRNPTFRLYQTKHLTLLAFMRQANLLENETGYVARPNPKIIDAFYWQAVELFSWVGTISNPQILNSLPRYRVSSENENMGNFSNYLDVLSEAKEDIRTHYRSVSDARKIESLSKAITLLNNRRAIYNKELTKGSNHLAAKWAMLVTRPPKDIVPFWYGILSSSSIKITFEGVKVGDTWQVVHASDLRELRDWLMEHLIEPRGEVKQTHLDDSEYYFMARKCVLDIVNRHITILEQGTASYAIVNAAFGNELQSMSDDKLEAKAIASNLPPKPDLSIYQGKKIDALRAMAKWRLATKQALVDLSNMEVSNSTPEIKKDTNYEII